MKLIELLKKSVTDAEPIWIDSKLLTHRNVPHHPQYEITADRNFDMNQQPITETNVYKAMKKRHDGEPWDTTLVTTKVDEKRRAEKIANWEQMMPDIIENGYNFRPLPDNIDEYISVVIGRDGQVILYNGIHRIVCCMLSKVENKIPVKVVYRHPEWDAFRNSVLKYAEKRGEIYCQITHPDLEAIPHHWTNNRAEMIAEHSMHKGGDVLDIGTHWGTTSRTLALSGFNCTAIEHDIMHFEKTRMVARIFDAPFTALHGDALSFRSATIDTLVMLNIAHHFQMKKDLFERFMSFLKANRFKEIFYQAHKDGDKWSTASAMCIPPKKYLELIMDAVGLDYVEELETFNGRALYHIF